MKKDKHLMEMSIKDAAAKHAELVKELVKSRLTLDGAALQEHGGLPGLQRQIKVLGRRLATKTATATTPGK